MREFVSPKDFSGKTPNGALGPKKGPKIIKMALFDS